MSGCSYIVVAKRSPIGRFQGVLSQIPATKLSSFVIKSLIKEAKVPLDVIDSCIMGQVLTSGEGQAPARQAALGAGISYSTASMTVNKVCGSGLKAIMLGADLITLKRAHLVVAGGQENMSLSPYILKNARGGFRLGNGEVIDTILYDGLTDPYDQIHMGEIGEICAEKHQVSRKEQDEFAKQSYFKAQKAQKEKLFQSEIVPILIKDRKSEIIINEDEEPQRMKLEKLATLKSVFKKEGTITAGNASKINDGAASVLLASEEALKKYNLKPIAKIVDQAVFAQEPKWFTTAPIESIRKILKQNNLEVKDIDLFEINEAFSVVALLAMKELKIPEDRLNVHGGAVALGHPIGASGARILTTLLHALKKYKKKRGLASICLGGGEAVSLIVEMI